MTVMMRAQARYQEWLKDEFIDDKIKEELSKYSGEEILSAFYDDLHFGTAGLRGILGAGTNRMNKITVSKATYAMGQLILESGKEASKKGCAIAYDVRHHSKDFALLATSILTSLGITVYLYEDIRTTPQLSYAVRYYKTQAGIMITASHNPKDYNGFKAYWDDGAQILPEIADRIEVEMNGIKSIKEIEYKDINEAEKEGLLKYIGKDIDEDYYKNVLSLSLQEDIDKSVSIVYTPLNGTGNIPVREILKRRGFTNVSIVKEQQEPDPDFTTVDYPNPEDKRAFELAIKVGEEKNASLLLANDPDCDRTAIMVYDGNSYIALNGNQIGAILIKYIMDALKSRNKLPKKGMIVKSIVTSDLGKIIARSYGVETFEALTGFKNICGVAIDKEKEGYSFLFGYEESIGYTAGTFVRDKDGVISSMLICEACAYYMKRNMSLYDVLEDIYTTYGDYRENNYSIILKGLEGKERIEKIMKHLRANGLENVNGYKVTHVTDYLNSKRICIETNEETDIDIPKSNVLKFEFGHQLWMAIRPSGTEPKIKIYIYGIGNQLVKTAREWIDKLIEALR